MVFLGALASRVVLPVTGYLRGPGQNSLRDDAQFGRTFAADYQVVCALAPGPGLPRHVGVDIGESFAEHLCPFLSLSLIEGGRNGSGACFPPAPELLDAFLKRQGLGLDGLALE
jgi:hypothetical protein